MAAHYNIDGHIGLRPNCGICGKSMVVHERFVALIGNIDSTAYSHRIGPRRFPDHGEYPHRVNGLLLCRRPDCKRCVASCEAATVHLDCFTICSSRFNEADWLNQLWMASAWRTPWRQAPHLGLQDTTVIPDVSILDALNLSRLKVLPAELTAMVHESSATSLLWRYSAALSFARQVSAAPLGDLLSVSLHTVSAWKRGSLPVTTKIFPVVIRLTIDSYGIRSIERLPEHPPFKTWRTDNLVFVVLENNQLTGINAHFKSGFLRLTMPLKSHGLQIWDTPTPPRLDRCFFYPAEITSSTQFHTIDLCQTTGLTFFFFNGQIYAIHAHTQNDPCAESTYLTLSRRRRRSITWVYLPIPPGDSLCIIGTQIAPSGRGLDGGTCLLFRMKLAGDITIGVNSTRYGKDLLLSKSSPWTLIYNISELQPISVIGAYSEDEISAITRFQHPLFDDPPFPNACVSSATLKGVTGITIFRHSEFGICMGILLEYEDGAQRSLGQCRIHVDSVEYYKKPVQICIFDKVNSQTGSARQLQTTLVKCTSFADHIHCEEGWKCFAMGVSLEFWFSDVESKLMVILN